MIYEADPERAEADRSGGRIAPVSPAPSCLQCSVFYSFSVLLVLNSVYLNYVTLD